MTMTEPSMMRACVEKSENPDSMSAVVDAAESIFFCFYANKADLYIVS